MLDKEILCTLGPASLKKTVLERMNDLPVTLLRINLSHTPVNDLEEIIRFIQSVSRKSICIDTEGAQIRTRRVVGGQVLVPEGSYLSIHKKNVPGNSMNISFHPSDVIDQVRTFDFISIDFNSVLVQVIEKNDDGLVTKVVTEGMVGSNKAVTVNRPIEMDALTEKDRVAIPIARACGVRHFALSFAGSKEDVLELRKLTGSESYLISKIESSSGIENLEAIIDGSNAILIDRGDLSREKPIEAVPLLQKQIIQKAKKMKSKVYVATNLLETMIVQSRPTRAEVNDVFNTLLDGADGLVLAAETAIGANPVGCVNMISKLIDQFSNYSKYGGETDRFDLRSLLIEPHGGVLIDRFLRNPDVVEIDKLPGLSVDKKTVLDCEQIASGVYSPLQGFMTREALESVLDHNRLPEGDVWTLPVVLQTQRNLVKGLSKGDAVSLIHEETGDRFAVLHVEELYEMDKSSLCQRMFGTNSEDHPGVSQIMQSGDLFLAGKIDLIQFVSHWPEITSYLLKPAETRMIFEQKNWFRIVGFHTRNVLHRGHEFIQMRALEDYHCDGLFVSPVVGPKKKNDFRSEIVLKAYQIMVDYNLYPKNKVLIGAFSTFPRYAGPREAVFTALCRKNFGCSHFIIGRDHTGVQNFYTPEASAQIFETIGDIGIKPIFFDEVAYCKRCKTQRLVCEHPESDLHKISGSFVREAIGRGTSLPSWLVRQEVSEMLLDVLNSNKPIFSD